MLSTFARLTGLVVAAGSLVQGFDINAQTNAAAYWGQNSGGELGYSPQQNIDYYCQDNSVDIFVVAFVNNFFSTGNLPNLDLTDTCADWNHGTFSGTDLPNCQFLQGPIQTCQAKGKIALISLGGGGANPVFSSDSQAQQFADTIWNVFLGGSSNTRPFGSAQLDGVDLDIEGGSQAHFPAFLNQLKSHFNGAPKKYYLTAAPQCPFPDANLGTIINQVGMDMIFVQFYNNNCATGYYPTDWDFNLWDSWAKNTSPNKNVKVYMGVSACPQCATWGLSWVPVSGLAPIINTQMHTYSSFGGVMYWEMSAAYGNGRFDQGIKQALLSAAGSSGSNPPPPTSGSHQIHPNGNNSKCLDVQGGVMANGTPVQIYDCNGTAAQNWSIVAGTTAVQVAGTNYCLDSGDTPGNGVQMKIWTCYSGITAQTWYYTDDKRIALQNQGQCLDLTNGSTANGNVMQTWACTTADTNQVWTE